MIRLSILIPSNRVNLTAYSRIVQACSWAGPNLEVIVRDNSGSAAKRQMLAQIERENCQIIVSEPCGPFENWTQLLRLAQGDFVFFLSDDDACFDRAIAALPEMIEGIVDDQSVTGIAGACAIESLHGSSIVAYPDIDSDDALTRISGYLSSNGPSVLISSPVRREVLKRTFDLINAMPFSFSFHDQIICLLYLLSGKFLRLKRLMYLYDNRNWDSSETGQQIDLSFYTAAKLDPAINKLHWFLCGFEGATLIRNLNTIPNYTLAQRQAMTDRWFTTMFIRFRDHKRADFGSPLSRDADMLCEKWKLVAGRLLFQDMLADICEFISLSSKDNSQKYHDFWTAILSTRQLRPPDGLAFKPADNILLDRPATPASAH